MRAGLCLAAIALIAVGVAAPAEAMELSVAPLLDAHSHNDYEQPHPLQDALSNGFDSVEADVYYRGGRLLVSHEGLIFKGTLEELYLDPLARLVAQQGSVYGDRSAPFYLWIDLKEGSRAIRDTLYQTLQRYSMLTQFHRDRVEWGPVTVVLTGDSLGKTAFIQEHPDRKATRDSNSMSAGDPQGDTGWSWYALDWRSYSWWFGLGPMPDYDRQTLFTLVREAHQHGRKLRVYGAPDSPYYWSVAVQAGMDLISTNDLNGLRSFLETQPTP